MIEYQRVGAEGIEPPTLCFDNAVLDTDRIENCKPVKRAANMEIDGVIAMLMCMRLFIDYER